MSTHKTIDPDVAYAQVEKMLQKLAWRKAQTSGLPFDACMSECNWAFMKALKRWDPKRGAFSTCVYTIASFRLRTFSRELAKLPVCEELNEELVATDRPDPSPTLELFRGVSEEANLLLELILETPAELLGTAPLSVRQLMHRIRRYLQRMGYTRDQLEWTERELACRLRRA